MDYFAKFKRRITPRSQPNAGAQLAKFHKCWKYVHHDYFLQEKRPSDLVRLSDIPSALSTMVDCLVLELNGVQLAGTVNATLGPGATGPCMEYLLKNNVLQTLVDVSEPDMPLGLRGEAIRTLASMVELLDDRFLVQGSVHGPVLKLLRITVGDRKQSELYEGDLVDLMFNVCAKIHGYPPLLNIFFHDKVLLASPEGASPKSRKSSLRSSSSFHSESAQGVPPDVTEQEMLKPQWEFLLWEYLLRFVHLQGRSGDLARTGLLFLVQLAQGPVQDFILKESDFPVVISAALDALYSQLPRRVKVSSISGSADVESPDVTFDVNDNAVDVDSPSFKEPLDAFLGLLEFCQDALVRCPSIAVTEAVLDSLRKIFLENVLMTSLLEANEGDGSAVAVCIYLEGMLSCLKSNGKVRGGLGGTIISFLMGEEEGDMTQYCTRDELQLDNAKNPANSPLKTISKFRLKDFLIARMHSGQPAVAITAMRLLKTLLNRHCRHAYNILDNQQTVSLSVDANLDAEIDTSPTPTLDSPVKSSTLSVITALRDKVPPPLPSISAHGFNRTSTPTIRDHSEEISLYLSLLPMIDPLRSTADRFQGYEQCVEDTETEIEEHCASQRHGPVFRRFSHSVNRNLDASLLATPLTGWQPSNDVLPSPFSQHFAASTPQKQPSVVNLEEESDIDWVPRHLPATADPLLNAILYELSRFFGRPPEVNLQLTGVIASLAWCPCRGTEGWLTKEATGQEERKKGPSSSLSLPTMPSTSDMTHDSTEGHGTDEGDGGCVDDLLCTSPDPTVLPSIYVSLKTLTRQIECYRSEMGGQPVFAKTLEETRAGLFGPRIPSSPPSTPLSSPTSAPKSQSSKDLYSTSLIFEKQTLPNSVKNIPATSASSNSHTAGSRNLDPQYLTTEQMIPLTVPTKFLDNVVVLEEAVKELIAIIQVRRGRVGIEPIRYV